MKNNSKSRTRRVFEGGTGNTAYLVAVIIAGDEYRNVDTITIPGDRAGVEITSINKGILTYTPHCTMNYMLMS